MSFCKKISFLIVLIIGVSTQVVANTIDSLLSRISIEESSDQPSKLASLYFQIGEEYHSSDLFEQGKEYFLKGLEKINIEQEQEIYFDLLLGLGRAHKRLNNYEKSLECFSKVIDSQKYRPENIVLANAHNYLGSIYQSLGEYEKSFQQQLKALHFHELEKDLNGIGRDYYGIGSLLFYQDRFDQALKYYKKANRLFTQIEHQRLIYSSLCAMGSTYAELGNFKESLEYGNKGLDLARELDYKTGIAYSLGNVAHVMLQLNQMDEAKEMLLEALKLKEDLNDPWAIIGGHLGLVKASLICKKPKKALPHLKIALELSIKIKSKTRELETYQQYKEVFKALGDYPKSYFYLEKYSTLKDSVLNEKTVEEMGQTKRKFEMEKKENEIALLKTKNENLEIKKKIQRLHTGIFLSLLLIVLIAFGVNAKNLKNQKQTNLVLEKQQKKIQNQNDVLQEKQTQLIELNNLLEKNNVLLEDKNEEIQTKNKQLKNSNEDLKNFAYVASHDLKEPLRMIHSYTSLLKRRYNDLFDETGQEFLFFVTDAVKRMDVMLSDLLDYSRIDSRGDSENFVEIKDVLLVVNSNLVNLLKENNATLIYKEENLPMVKSNTSKMVQLFQNLISNAIKFKGENNPTVEIDCRKDANEFIFSIKDNGIGIAPENHEKVFEMFKRLHSREEYEGTGIGLATCKKIVQKYGGEIWIESEIGEGTTFFFSMPVPVEELVEV